MKKIVEKEKNSEAMYLSNLDGTVETKKYKVSIEFIEEGDEYDIYLDSLYLTSVDKSNIPDGLLEIFQPE